MQEDIENRTVTLMVNSSKFTGRTMLSAIRKFLAHMKNRSPPAKDVTPHGKQTVKQLIQKDQGVTSVELNDPHIRDFERVARKYGVDYAIKRVKGEPNKYSKKFLAEHEGEIALHKAAKKAFDELGLKKLPTIKTLRAEYAALLAEKKQTYAEYRQARDEMRQLLKAKANVELLLGIDDKPMEHEKHGDREQR